MDKFSDTNEVFEAVARIWPHRLTGRKTPTYLLTLKLNCTRSCKFGGSCPGVVWNTWWKMSLPAELHLRHCLGNCCLCITVLLFFNFSSWFSSIEKSCKHIRNPAPAFNLRVVVREFFSLGTSAICVGISGYKDCLPHGSNFRLLLHSHHSHDSGFIGIISTLFGYVNIKLLLFFACMRL